MCGRTEPTTITTDSRPQYGTFESQAYGQHDAGRRIRIERTNYDDFGYDGPSFMEGNAEAKIRRRQAIRLAATLEAERKRHAAEVQQLQDQLDLQREANFAQRDIISGQYKRFREDQDTIAELKRELNSVAHGLKAMTTSLNTRAASQA